MKIRSRKDPDWPPKGVTPGLTPEEEEVLRKTAENLVPPPDWSTDYTDWSTDMPWEGHP